MFIPAENTSAHLRDDTRIFDASGLTIHQPADDEVSNLAHFADIFVHFLKGVNRRPHQRLIILLCDQPL